MQHVKVNFLKVLSRLLDLQTLLCACQLKCLLADFKCLLSENDLMQIEILGCLAFPIKKDKD